EANLCSDQRFAAQVTPGSCSGFLVGPDVLVTAGHCVSNQKKCEDKFWVFGFTREEAADLTLSGENVYKCSQVLYQVLNQGDKNDYAVIKLDRPVEGREPL